MRYHVFGNECVSQYIPWMSSIEGGDITEDIEFEEFPWCDNQAAMKEGV